MTVRGPAEKALVQTSRDLVTWVTRDDMEFTGGSEGQGEIAGSASFRLAWGEIVRAGQYVSETVTEPTDLDGILVRVCKQNLAGTGTVTHGDDTFDPVWHGKMLAPDAATSGGNGVTSYTASGIASLFNECTCWVGRALVKTSPLLFSIAFNLAPFNHWPSGDRSADLGSVGGKNIYLHDATKQDTGLRWTARQILDNLLACNFRVEHPPTPAGTGQAGFDFDISDPQGCLSYDPGRYDARGKTFTQVLNDLAGKHRGLTWWVTVDGATLVLNFDSGLASPVTVGTTTIPANPNIWDQLDGNDPFIHPFTIRRVSDEMADVITVQGSSRLIGVSLAIYGAGDPFVADVDAQLGKGWSDGIEPLCNAFLDANPGMDRKVAYEHAWQRFVLRPTGWTGDQHGGTGGMPWALTTASDASYGANGFNGEVTEGAGGGEKPATWYTAEGLLPCALGFTALNVGPRQPLVVIAEDYDSGVWYDHTADWTVWVEESPPAVVIDDGANGFHVRSILRAGRKILVTIALRDFFPFQVSWRRDPELWPSLLPRTKTIIKPELSQEYLMNGMTTGVDESTGARLTTTKITTKDNLPQLRALLAQARAFYEEPYDLVSFTDRGTWDTNPAYRPGTMLGNVMDGANTKVIEALVTRRTWRLEYAAGEDGVSVPYWSTTYETDTIYPDLEAVL